MRKSKILALSLAVASLVSLTGCESSGSGTTSQSDVKQGSFIDSKVEGIEYSTETQKGITDENGNFSYIDGETVTFKIGGILLGTSKANEVLTPLDILGVTSATSKNATDMFIMLQSLDEDKNASNGIKISEKTLEDSKSMNIDFTQENKIDVTSTLSQLGLSSSDIKSQIDAQKHFTETILSIYANANDTLTTEYLNGKKFYTKSFVDDNGNYYYRYSIVTFSASNYTVKEYNDYDGGRTWDEMGEEYTISNNTIVGNHINAKLVKITDNKLILLESYGYPESWGPQIEEYWLTKPANFPSE